MKKQIASMWVRALRSGKYEQGIARLKNKHKEYCCLGVLADISGVEPSMIQNQGDLSEITAEVGICSMVGRPKKGKVLGKYASLAHANDNGESFSSIANWIEKNYKLL